MSMYKEISKLWKNPKKNLGQAYKDRLIAWRKEPSTVRIERPTRLDRARSLGYKAKQGIFMVRQAVPRGSHQRPKFTAGRRPKTMRRVLVLDKNYRQLSEERVSKKFPNCEVLNSYYVGKDGQTTWYEVIMVDRDHPRIKTDKSLSFLNTNKHKGRANRGLTSAAKKSRGLRHKGKGSEKTRLSSKVKKRRME